MIRRITKNTDLKDIIRSIPSDVINNIEQVRYYVYGYENKFIAPEFTQEGDILKVIIPAEDLKTLPDGLFYRQCLYNKDDVDYPDGEYNLSITDNLELWIYSKENSVQPPIGSNYLQEDDLKTINGESLVGKGDIVIQTTAENIECGPISSGLFNFSNVNEGLIQITDTVEEINNTKEDKKPVFYIDVIFDGPSVITSYADYMSIGAQIKQLGADNVVLYVRDTALDILNIPDSVGISGSNFTIEGYAYNNLVYRITPVTSSSKVQIDFNLLTTYNTMTSNINGVKTWVVNQKYAKKTELKTINGQSIVGSGDITIQATGGITEEWLQNNLKTINGESLIGGGDLAVQKPIEISIDIDSGQLLITYDEYKAMIDEYANDGGYTRKLMIYFGSATTGLDCSSYPSDIDFNTREIGGYFLDNRGENNKRLVYYRIKGNDATQKIELTLTPIPSNADIPDLTGYATETWVESKGYLTEHQSLADYALKTEIPSLDGYVQETNLKTINGESIVGSGNITIQATGGVTEEWVTSQGYATETWVSNQGYLTEHQSLAGYALKSEIPDVSGYALKTEIPDVTGYALKTEIPDVSGYALKSEIPDVTGYATQTYVDNKIGQIDTLLDQMLG